MEIICSIQIFEVIQFSYVTGTVLAQKDLWILGDAFVNDNFHALPALNKQRQFDHKDPLFMYQQFNVRCFTANPASRVKSTSAKIINCLIKPLNDKTKEENENIMDKFLPRIIIVIPEWDLLKNLDHGDCGADKVFGETINWMIQNLIETVEDQKKQMMKIKPGSVTRGEPKFIWVKVIRRLGSYDKVMSVRNIFNSILEKTLSKKKHHYIIDPEPAISNARYFLKSNDLSADGRVSYWREINDSIELFEIDKLKLQPNADPNKEDNRNQNAYHNTYRLPPIMPRRTQPQNGPRHRNDRFQSNNNPSRHNSSDQSRGHFQRGNNNWCK